MPAFIYALATSIVRNRQGALPYGAFERYSAPLALEVVSAFILPLDTCQPSALRAYT